MSSWRIILPDRWNEVEAKRLRRIHSPERQDAVPERIIRLNENASPDDVAAFRRWWYEQIATGPVPSNETVLAWIEEHAVGS